MKTHRIRINSLIPLLGAVLVAAGVLAAVAYREFEQKNHSAELSMERMNRLYLDVQLCEALRTMRDGDLAALSRHLDLLVCNDIIALNDQLASADPGERAFIRNAFARLALIRPRSAELLTDDSEGLRADQIEAESILERAGAGTTRVKTGIAAVP